MSFMQACKEFGLVGGLLLMIVAGVLTMCGFGFKWILAQFKVELDGSRKERTDYLCTLNKISNMIDENDKRAAERGNYVRLEHKELLDIAKETLLMVKRVNGSKL